MSFANSTGSDGATPTARAWHSAIPVLIGLAAFLLFVGPRALDPTNIAWLTRGDQWQHYLSWAYWREAPWLWPIGQNPDFGIELATTVAYTDAIPLLAVPFKVIEPLLPDPFQYYGFWLFACYMLQALFAWTLVGKITQNLVWRAIAVGFFVSSPIMIDRTTAHLSNTAHMTLAGHFLLLASLVLYLRPVGAPRWLGWGVLLCAVSAIHGYLFAMIGAFWAVDLFRHAIWRALSLVRAGLVAVATVLAVAAVMYALGLIGTGQTFVSEGFGRYRMNLLALIDHNGWSWFLPEFPNMHDDYEGFNYLGIGMIGLAVYGLVRAVRLRLDLRPWLRARWPLVTLCLALTAFAISTTVGLADMEFVLPVHDTVEPFGNIFRASGRFFWPVYYLVMLGILWLALNTLPVRWIGTTLGVALLLQVADAGHAWTGMRKIFMQTPAREYPTPLEHSFWDFAGARYEVVRILDIRNHQRGWQVPAIFALKHGLPTDSVYLSRMESELKKALMAQSRQMQRRGDYALDTLYFVRDNALQRVMRGLNRDRDMLAEIDGHVVVAPGWMTCAACLAVYHPADYPPVTLSDRR